jgi:hypothetical protein
LHFISMKTCNLLTSVLLSHLATHNFRFFFIFMLVCQLQRKHVLFTPFFPSIYQLNTLMKQLTCSHLLFVDLSSLNGSSSTSETFNNPCLSLSQEFEVKHVEVHDQWYAYQLILSISILSWWNLRVIMFSLQLWGFVNASKYDEMLTVCNTEKPGIWNLWLFTTFLSRWHLARPYNDGLYSFVIIYRLVRCWLEVVK